MKAGSSFIGSSHQVRPSASQAARVCSRVIPRSGRRSGPRAARHTGEGAGTRPADEAEEHLLGLVVAGVPEEDDGGTEPVGGVVERGVAGVAGGGLQALAGGRRDRDRDDLDRVQPERRAGSSAAALGDLGRAGLEPVVDDDRARRAGPCSAASKASAVGERQRVGAAAARDEDEVAGVEVGQGRADGDADRRDRGVRPASLASPHHLTTAPFSP